MTFAEAEAVYKDLLAANFDASIKPIRTPLNGSWDCPMCVEIGRNGVFSLDKLIPILIKHFDTGNPDDGDPLQRITFDKYADGLVIL